ncbi:MAG TPA: bifunctional UDP-sugar hydrolase/5'-nucleotidase [Bacteroidales bacterium]|jgi:2',3'-cyclic-nucleotide 2'-phosphodiesterase/3'-nucleotidase|nr:bifunctional UDP-sugar hydrolase/5'-nucleotidase [Bacteroidales bacterium]HQH23395.1 bifunctional UDP-sugar hydrolase/5'-nucleotidase [Bacteroidales bacterium]HQJ81360.1 bifunctional UDP-sugar hydrolase/5'-nucleotidase [Bacteroidales bacterium]
MKYLKTRISLLILLIPILVLSCGEGTIRVSVVETTDIHGVILPYDFIDMKPFDASLAHASSFFKMAAREKDAVFLLDNGDNIQGQPAVYYYNYVDTLSPHLMSDVFNFLGYDAAAVGNHDIEAGHSVYDRLRTEYNFPLLAANAVDVSTGEPYFSPYALLEKKGIKIAVLGLTTPFIPNWLPEELYSGMEFRDMVSTAEFWMPRIKKEEPDLIVGLFHSGWNSQNTAYHPMEENGSAAVAYNVPGFDIIFTGHDHRVANETFVNREGDTLLILNGGSRAQNIAVAEIEFSLKGRGKVMKKKIRGHIVETASLPPDDEFMQKFSLQGEAVNKYVSRVIGNSESDISSRDSYFGSSPFVDMIHSIQLKLTGADISFAAPLSFDEVIRKGPVTVGDMFKLYRFENTLYTMKMTGEEIRKYLDYSYSLWLNPMKGPGDFLLKYRLDDNGRVRIINGRAWLRNQSYNFDSAAGLDYIADVSRPDGKMVIVRSLSDGRPFEKHKYYTVALNSYRGNGGGGHLTRGAGIKAEELKQRLINSTERDLRHFILGEIEAGRVLAPKALKNWKIVPEKWVENAVPRETELLFGKTN